MTIDLGFAWLTLPNRQEISIVDVPGHERFIKNVRRGGRDRRALLVVAADEDNPQPGSTWPSWTCWGSAGGWWP